MKLKTIQKKFLNVVIVLLFGSLATFAQKADSLSFSTNEARALLDRYINYPLMVEQVDSCNAQEKYFRGKIHDDSLLLNYSKILISSKDDVINSHEQVKKNLEKEIKNKKNAKTLWQCISAGITGLFLYKELK